MSWIFLYHEDSTVTIEISWYVPRHKPSRLNLSALAITDTELKLIAAAAIIGESNIPEAG